MSRWIVLTFWLALFACGADAVAGQSGSSSPTRFTRDPARLEMNEARVVAELGRQSPQAATELAALFAQDWLAGLEPELRRQGLDSQDMADMTAAYWIVAWEAVHGIVGQKTDPALARGARDQVARVFHANPNVARLTDTQRQDIADTMLLKAVLAELRMTAAARLGAAAQRRMSDAIHAEASKLLNTDLRKVTLTASGFAPAGNAAAPTASVPAIPPLSPTLSTPPVPAARPTPLAAPAHEGNWARVQGVYFRSTTGFGVGGMVIVDFEPVVFFRDGTYYEVEGQALEDVDLPERRRAKPERWGRWTGRGNSFTLTDARGRQTGVTLQGGNFFQAFPADANGNRLDATYKRVSGGGNSAMGGEVTIAAQTNLTFAADGSYRQASSAGAISSGQQTGVGTSVSSRGPPRTGRYRIERHTITLIDPDGQQRREFFAFGSRGTPPQPSTDMIFLGDRVFVSDR